MSTTETTTVKPGRQGGYLAKKPMYLARLDNMPNTYPVELKDPYSPFTLGLMDSGNRFEDTVGQAIADALGDRALVIAEERDANGERTVAGKQAKERATFEAVVSGSVEVIFNARIGGHFEELMAAHLGLDDPELDPTRVSEPDMMVRGRRLETGVFSWYPVDVKDHKAVSGPTKAKPRRLSRLTTPGPADTFEADFEGQLNKDDWFQLAHYYRHFENIGIATGLTDALGAVIGRPVDLGEGPELVLFWHSLTEPTFQRGAGDRTYVSPLDLYDPAFARGLAVVANAKACDLDPTLAPLVEPEWESGIAESPWASVILAELKAYRNGAGHITLLPGVTVARAREIYYPLGVTGIDQLAALSTTEAFDAAATVLGLEGETGKGAVTKITKKADSVLRDIAQARVWISGIPHRVEGKAAMSLPSADVEIDIDLESDERLYMYGLATSRQITGKDGKVRTHRSVTVYDDFTNTDAGELAVFVKTWRHLTRAIAKASAAGQSIRIYHYSAHERTWFRNMTAKHAGAKGVPTLAEMEAFLNSPVLVDMYAVVRTEVLWPTMSHSIKKIAPLAAFAWRDEQPGGDQSIAWYREAVADPSKRAGLRKRLRVYNTDDVLATAKVREWFYANGSRTAPGAGFPSVEDLDLTA